MNETLLFISPHSIDPASETISSLKRRRVLFKLQRVTDLVTALSDPADPELNILQNAFELILKQCQPDMTEKTTAVCLYPFVFNIFTTLALGTCKSVSVTSCAASGIQSA